MQKQYDCKKSTERVKTMKAKILLWVITIILLAGCGVVFASDTELYATVEQTYLPEMYLEPEIRLFRAVSSTPEETLIEGWSNFATQISVKKYGISTSEISRIYKGIVFKNPKLYYVQNGFRYSYNPTTNLVIDVYPEYYETDTKVIAETMEAIDAATEEILFCLDESMTDFEKVMTVHDYMVLHYEYDYTYSNYDITIMMTKKGVCMAYTMAFMHLMNELGIECQYIASNESMDHAWNLVKIDGEWYHIDLTWDDPGTNEGQVRHKYALLSDYEIQHLESPHYDYEMNGLEAVSDKFDKAHWHDGIGSIVTIDKIYYFVDEKNLVDQNGTVIYEDLDGGDGGWSIGGGYQFRNGNYAGIAEHNGILFFNTDEAIYSYHPKKKEIIKVVDYDGVCGLFIDKNTLKYYKYDMDTEKFIEAGNYPIGKIRFGGTFHQNNKIIKRIYNESEQEPIFVYADCGECIKSKKITETGISKISFDEKATQTLFYWDENMKPLKEKEVYNQ